MQGKRISFQNQEWTTAQKQANHAMGKLFKKDFQLLTICETLEKINIKYLPPSHFFSCFMPVQYHAWEDTFFALPESGPKELNCDFTFCLLRYFLVFQIAATAAEESNLAILFGSFWLQVSAITKTPLQQFLQSKCRDIISSICAGNTRILTVSSSSSSPESSTKTTTRTTTTTTTSSVTQPTQNTNVNQKNRNGCLFQSGIEYEVVTEFLSKLLLKSMNSQSGSQDSYKDKDKYSEDEELENNGTSLYTQEEAHFLGFFSSTVKSPLFHWSRFLQTKENRNRFLYLMKFVILFLLKNAGGSKTKKWIQQHLDSQVPVTIEEIEENHELKGIPHEIVKNVLFILQEICAHDKSLASMKSNFQYIESFLTPPNELQMGDTKESKDSSSSSFSSTLNTELMSRFCPFVSSFSITIQRDPSSKNETCLIYFVRFNGLHPRFCYPCSRIDLGTLCYHGLFIDQQKNEFLKQNEYFVPLKDFSPCKLRKRTRLDKIVEDALLTLKQRKTNSDYSYEPWFKHEEDLFARLQQKYSSWKIKETNDMHPDHHPHSSSTEMDIEYI